MLTFREAAAANDVEGMQRLWNKRGDDFNIDEKGMTSGRTAAHFAAGKACFRAIYWLFEKGADFYSTDNTGKTVLDYLQQKEFSLISQAPMSKEDRQYHLCNAHYKIWLAHDPEIFMPYLYQDDFRQYREKNPDGYISLVYSISLLSEKALSDLTAFATKYQITLISFEKCLATLTDQFGTKEDKKCYQLALKELASYPKNQGGNLAVVADLLRWSSVLLRKGNYSDTDVEIGQHKWTGSIPVEKPCVLNLGSLIYPKSIELWLNGDIIALPSLFEKPHSKGEFRITLSKTACFIIRQVQSSLIFSCQQRMNKRIKDQKFLTTIFSNISLYSQDYFKSYGSDPYITKNFLFDEIYHIQANGLKPFSQDKRASIIEKMANLMRKKVEEEYETPELAHQYSELFQKTKSHEHEKFLMFYMQAIERANIKNDVKELTGSPVFVSVVWKCIENDEWKKYSIYAKKEAESAFRSTNTVRLDMDHKKNEWIVKTQKCADLSFTSLGMANVLTRSKALKEEHDKN